MAFVVPAIAVAGLALSAYSTYNTAQGAALQGAASANQYKYQAAVAGINAKIAQQNADYARYAGEVQTQQSGMQTRFGVGEATVAQGASNVNVSTGSAAAVRSSMGEVGRQNEALLRADAAKRAYGYEVEGVSATAQGQLDTLASGYATTAAGINVAGSIAGGASSVASKWLQGQQQGVWGGLFGGAGISGGTGLLSNQATGSLY